MLRARGKNICPRAISFVLVTLSQEQVSNALNKPPPDHRQQTKNLNNTKQTHDRVEDTADGDHTYLSRSPSEREASRSRRDKRSQGIRK